MRPFSILPENSPEYANGPAELFRMRQHIFGFSIRRYERGPQVQEWLRQQQAAEQAGLVASTNEVAIETNETAEAPLTEVIPLHRGSAIEAAQDKVAQALGEAA